MRVCINKCKIYHGPLFAKRLTTLRKKTLNLIPDLKLLSSSLLSREPIRVRLRLKCDGTHAETIFRVSEKWTSPFKSAGASVQSTAGSRGVRISGSNAGYTMFRGSVKGTGHPHHSPVSPSLPPSTRHRVPSHFNWTLPTVRNTAQKNYSQLRKKTYFCFYTINKKDS